MAAIYLDYNATTPVDPAVVEEMLPFLRDQHGLLGHLFGGWMLSGTYIISSGQPYTPIQYELNYETGGTAYDSAFDLALANGFYETARPFGLSPSAPANQVAIYGGDLCTLSGVASVCSGAPTQLYSWNAYNAQGTVQTVSASQARFLVNGAYADSVYGEPWGTAARNSLRDAIINQGNFQITKETHITERVKVQFWSAFQNVFNHPNFATVDPFVEDSGLTFEGVGFATPSLTNGGNRLIKFGLKLFF